MPEFVSHTFMIHNGKIFHKLFVTDDMVGHKLESFPKHELLGLMVV